MDEGDDSTEAASEACSPIRRLDMSAVTIALKPCPFCGGEASVSFTDSNGLRREENNTGYYVSCSKCDCEIGFKCECDSGYSGDFKTREAAAEAWNHRVI